MDRAPSAIRDQRVIVLFSHDEKTQLERLAARAGLTVSAYMRALLLSPGSLPTVPANQTAPVAES